MVKVKNIGGSSLFTVILPQNELKPTPILKTDSLKQTNKMNNKQAKRNKSPFKAKSLSFVLYK